MGQRVGVWAQPLFLGVPSLTTFPIGSKNSLAQRSALAPPRSQPAPAPSEEFGTYVCVGGNAAESNSEEKAFEVIRVKTGGCPRTLT